MFNQSQYAIAYPNLAQFNNPDSPTYTRKSKTGKMVVVRKGRRKRNNLALAAGTTGGLIAGNLAMSIPQRIIVKKHGFKHNLQGIKSFADKYPGKNTAIALSSLAALGTGAYAGYRVAKKLTEND